MSKWLEKTIMTLLCFVAIGSIIAGCGVSKVQVKETKASLSWRQNEAVKKIIENLKPLPPNKRITVDSIFIGFDKEVISEIRKEIRGKVEPGLATEPLKETAGNLLGMFKKILGRYFIEDAMEIKELFGGIDPWMFYRRKSDEK